MTIDFVPMIEGEASADQSLRPFGKRDADWHPELPIAMARIANVKAMIRGRRREWELFTFSERRTCPESAGTAIGIKFGF